MSFSLSQSRVLVTDGDSITAGNNPGVIFPYPPRLTLNGTWAVHNVAISGQTLATCLANAPTTVDPFYDSLAPENVCVIWAGTNDIANNSTNVNAVYANMISYVAARHAVGWKVVVVTMLTKGSPSTTDTARAAYNALIIANSAGADAVVNFAGTPIGTNGAAGNATYFQDTLHPTQLAIDTIEVPTFNTTINGLTNIPPRFLFVQSASGNGGPSVSSFSTAFVSNTTAKNVLLAMAWCNNAGAITNFSDGVNTWTKIGSTLTPAGFNANVYICNSAVGGPVNATLTTSALVNNLGIGLLEYSGPFKNPPLAQFVSGTGSSTAASVGPLTTTIAKDALIAIIFSGTIGGTHTPENGWQFRLNVNDAVFSEDVLAVSPGPYTATATVNNGPWSGLLLDFQPSNLPTPGTIHGVYSGANFSAAFANPSGLDIMQVVNEGNKVVWNLTASGVANINPVSPTAFSVLGKFFGANFTQAFNNNPYNLDVLQVLGQGGAVVFHLDYLGNANTP